jgi:hypothetical protein
MKVAVIGSRNLTIDNLQDYLPAETNALVSGAAKGIDTSVREYAQARDIPLSEYLPDYANNGRGALLKRNLTIIENSEIVFIFWDGQSKGAKYVIDDCKRLQKPHKVYIKDENAKDTWRLEAE